MLLNKMKTTLSFFLILSFVVSIVGGDTVADPRLGFTLELPSEFRPRSDLIGASPDVVHAFEFREAAAGEVPVLVFIEKLGGVIGRERLTKQSMPSGFTGELFVTSWQDFEIDGFEVPEKLNGIDVVTFNVQVPLKREAIQIKLFGPLDRREELRALLPQILVGLKGESNWFSSVASTPIAASEDYGKVLLGLGIGGVIVGLVLLWLVSKWAPKGTVLAIAIGLYATSWSIDRIRIREVRMLSGAMRMLGFAGGILGVIDLVRTRKPKNVRKQDDEIATAELVEDDRSSPPVP